MATSSRPNWSSRQNPTENPSPTTEAPSSSSQTSSYDQFGHGHYFTKKTFHKPTYCHHCTDMLWGLIGQGYICEGKEYKLSLSFQPFH